MLVSSTQSSNKPRIISELKKNNGLKSGHHYPTCTKPHISGDVVAELYDNAEETKYVEVRDGYLIVFNCSRLPELKLALHHLNLQADPRGRPLTFCLTKHDENITPIVTISSSCQQEYDRWVKTIAAELLSQTPLEAVRFLDILGITATVEFSKSNKPFSKDKIKEDTTKHSPILKENIRHDENSNELPDVIKDLPTFHLTRADSPFQYRTDDCFNNKSKYKKYRDKEQKPEWFNERLLLFESLCNRHPNETVTRTRSNDINIKKQRARSLYNLSQDSDNNNNYSNGKNNTLPVKDICKYFENKNVVQRNYDGVETNIVSNNSITSNNLQVGITNMSGTNGNKARRRFSHLDHSFVPKYYGERFLLPKNIC